MHEMTGRERSLKAMNFEATDRLPIMANTLPARFAQHLTGMSEEEYWNDQMEAQVRGMKILGMDFYIQKWFPIREEAQRGWSPAETEQWRDVEKVVADLEQETAKMEANFRARTAEEQEKFIQKVCAYQVETQARLGEEVLWPFGMDAHGPACLGFPYGKYGYEGFFLACALYPDVLGRYWAAAARLERWHNECVAEAARRIDYPRIGYLGSDMTDQRGNMVSPRFMDRYFFPHLDYVLSPLVDDGFKLVWHSDGNMNDMLRPLISIGIAGFQGFQEECGTRIADVARLRNRSGDPLILWGSVSVINVVGPGTFADIRREVQRVLDEWPHPGLCLGTSSYIAPDVSEENIIELFRAMRTLGAVQRSLKRQIVG